MFCSKCGKENIDGAKFCQSCGEILAGYQNYSSNEFSHGANSDYENQMLEAFVSKPEKITWYKEAFKKFDQEDSNKMIWHWSWYGFFFGMFFLMYRKAYSYAFLILAISTALGLSETVIQTYIFTEVSGAFQIFSSATTIIIMILVGGFATQLIHKSYKTKKKEIESYTSDNYKRIEMMKSKGGVNKWLLWIIAILFILIILAAIGKEVSKEKYPQEVKQNFISQCVTNPNISYASCECLINKIEEKVDYKTFIVADTQYIQGIDGKEKDEIQSIMNEAIPSCRGL